MNAPLQMTFGGRFDLNFARVGERTCITRQYVSYPFHLTRSFTLDPAIPDLTTLYQQSASGGLYRADSLSSRLELAAGARVHLTTQAATMVHDCQGRPAGQTMEIAAGENTFLALTPDPCVLFPGAALQSHTAARLSDGAVVLLSEAFTWHDPLGTKRPFDRYLSDVRIIDAGDDRLLARDRMEISGSDLADHSSPMGHWRIAAAHFLLGPKDRLPDRAALIAATDRPEAVGGISALPNKAGWAIRVLAKTAVANKSVAESLFTLAVETALGATPAMRRK